MIDELAAGSIYRFGEFILDGRVRELRGCGGQAIRITSKAFDVLCYLVNHRDRVVTKDELLSAVWPGRVVEENNLNQAVSALRQALGGGAKDRRFIVTLPGKGYRFVADVGEVNKEADPAIGVEVKVAEGADDLVRPSKWWILSLAAAALMTVIAWSVQHRLGSAPPQPPTEKSLAVLPFRALNGEASDPLLEIGIADTLIARLGRHEHMRVLSLDSALSAAESGSESIAVGRRLQADYLVEGSTQRLQDHVRVNVRLVDLHTGNTIWANSIDESMERVFHLQDGIAHGISEALNLKTKGVAEDTPSPCEGENIEAYRALLTGHYVTGRPVGKNLTRALDEYRRAIDLDPSCASAYAGMAKVLRAQTITGNRDPRELMPLSLAAVEKALAIDPNSAEAYVQLGFFRLWYERDWAAAEAAFLRAIDLAPNLSDAHFGYAHLLIFLNRYEAALTHISRARELDPLKPLTNTMDAGMLGAAGQETAALKNLQRSLELAPDFWLTLYVRGGMMLDRGEPMAAVEDLKVATEGSGGNNQVLGLLVMAYAAAGNFDAAQATLNDLNTRASQGYVPSSALAAAYLGIGEAERALDLLERAYDERDVRIAYMGIDARWNALREHPRFSELLKKLGFSAEPGRARF